MTGIYNLLDFGGAGDGKTKNSDAFNKAIQECTKNGGGVVFVPAGKFLTGPIHLKSNITLYLSAGAIVLFSQDPADYPIVKTRWEGTECHALSPMLFGDGVENVSVSGKGILDGQGMSWWKDAALVKSGKSDQLNYPFMKKLLELNSEVMKIAGSGGGGFHSGYLRPSLIQFKDSKNITIEGITARNSAFWNTHILYCTDVTIHDAKFVNPDNSPNTDGLDIDSSRGMRISNCTFDVGDDCLVIKSGMDEDGVRVGRPTEHITVTNCTMMRGHGGVVFGSECSGGVRNIVVSNCIFNGTDRGIRIKSRRERGGYIENVRVSNIIMEDVISPLVFNLYYKCGATDDKVASLNSKEKQPVTKYTPYIKNFQISNISSYKTRSACGVFFGLPEMPIEGIHLSDVLIEMDKKGELNTPAMNFDETKLKKAGFVGSNMKNCSFRNINIIGLEGTAIDITDSEGIEVSGLKVIQEVHAPVVRTKNCKDINVSGSNLKDGDIVKE
jgi:polygalacturonase